jgi:putative transposase
MDEHLDEPDEVDPDTGRRANIRYGHGEKTVQTEIGPVRIQISRDRAGTGRDPTLSASGIDQAVRPAD